MTTKQQGWRRWVSMEASMSMRGGQAIACLLLTMVLSAGCAGTRHAMTVDKSGFLGQGLYSKMMKGDEDKLESALRWRDDSAIAAGRYTKILLDPIVMYRQPQHEGGGTSNEDTQMLLNYFHNKLYLALGKHFDMVEKPVPGTARYQVALTDYEQSWVALDMVSTAVPQMLVLGELKALATEKPSFVGGAQVEAKVSDAETGKVLAALVDRRVGGKTLSKGFDSWSDVKNTMDFWALQAAYKACQVAHRPDCGEKPKP